MKLINRLFSVLACIAMMCSILSAQQDQSTYKLGINLGKHSVDKVYNNAGNAPHPQTLYASNPIKNITTFIRIFHLMEDDYPTAVNPGTNWKGVPRLNDPVYVEGGWSRMHDGAKRIKTLKNDGFNVRLSPEVIVNPDITGSSYLPFPSKFWSKEQMGRTSAERKEKAKKWATAFLNLYGGADTHPDFRDRILVDQLELGNEPWGYPELEGLDDWYAGVIEAFEEFYNSNNAQAWDIEVHAPALQAAEFPALWSCAACDNPNNVKRCPDCVTQSGDHIQDHFPAAHPHHNQLAGYNSHPYSFHITGGNGKITLCPENTNSQFNYLFNLKNWIDSNTNPKPIALTEVGWDSKIVGDLAQASYLVRSLLLCSELPWVSLMYIYEDLNDSPDGARNESMGLYRTSGILNQRLDTRDKRFYGTPKRSYKALLQYKNILGEGKFVERLETADDKDHIYLVDDGSGTQYLAAWRGIEMNTDTDPTNLSSFDKIVSLPMLDALAGKSIDQTFQIDGENMSFSPSDLSSSDKGTITTGHFTNGPTSLDMTINPVVRLFRLTDGVSNPGVELSVNVPANKNLNIEIRRPVNDIITIQWGDGNQETIPAGTTLVDITKTYPSNFTGRIGIEGGENITSLKVKGGFNFDICELNVFEKLETFAALAGTEVRGNPACLGRIKNLIIRGSSPVSLNLADVRSNTLLNNISLGKSTNCLGNARNLPANLKVLSLESQDFTIGGKLSDLPRQLQYATLKAESTLSGDLSNLPSTVKRLHIRGNNTIGDFSGSLPTGLQTLDIPSQNSRLDATKAKQIILKIYQNAQANNITKLFVNMSGSGSIDPDAPDLKVALRYFKDTNSHIFYNGKNLLK